MYQQINLYQPILSEERKALSANTAVIGLVLILAALAVFTVHANLSVAALERSVEGLRAQQVKQAASLAQSSEIQNARAKPLELEARIKELTTSVADRERALQLLQSGTAGQTTGFAPRMEALARRHIEGLWIDGMQFSGTNGSMSLSGSAVSADIVPVYLQGLALESVLSGTRFDDFLIERPSLATPADGAAANAADKKALEAADADYIRFRAASKLLLPAKP